MAGKILYLTLLVCFACAVVAQDTSRYIDGEKGCYIKEMDKIIPVGSDLTPPGQCLRVKCGDKQLKYTLCGDAKNTDPNCFITPIDLTKSFPDCCPMIKCFSKVPV